MNFQNNLKNLSNSWITPQEAMEKYPALSKRPLNLDARQIATMAGGVLHSKYNSSAKQNTINEEWLLMLVFSILEMMKSDIDDLRTEILVQKAG